MKKVYYIFTIVWLFIGVLLFTNDIISENINLYDALMIQSTKCEDYMTTISPRECERGNINCGEYNPKMFACSEFEFYFTRSMIGVIWSFIFQIFFIIGLSIFLIKYIKRGVQELKRRII